MVHKVFSKLGNLHFHTFSFKLSICHRASRKLEEVVLLDEMCTLIHAKITSSR